MELRDGKVYSDVLESGKVLTITVTSGAVKVEGTIGSSSVVNSTVSSSTTYGPYLYDVMFKVASISGVSDVSESQFTNQLGTGGSTSSTAIASSGSSQSLSFPASGDASYDITLDANCTFSFSGGTAGQLQTLTLIIRQSGDGGFIPAFPAGVKWPGGTAPIPNTTAGKIDVVTIQTPDAGTTLLGGY